MTQEEAVAFMERLGERAAQVLQERVCRELGEDVFERLAEEQAKEAKDWD